MEGAGHSLPSPVSLAGEWRETIAGGYRGIRVPVATLSGSVRKIRVLRMNIILVRPQIPFGFTRSSTVITLNGMSSTSLVTGCNVSIESPLIMKYFSTHFTVKSAAWVFEVNLFYMFP